MPHKVAHCDFPTSNYCQCIRHHLPPFFPHSPASMIPFRLCFFVMINKALPVPNVLLNFTPRPTLSVSMRESLVQRDAIFMSLVALVASSYLHPFTCQHPRPIPSLHVSLHSSWQPLQCCSLDRDAALHYFCYGDRLMSVSFPHIQYLM